MGARKPEKPGNRLDNLGKNKSEILDNFSI